ncbi:hypothetical protein BDW22DRAFT_463973 [Trametopsis cervina]|nr:hypothetical protein BDW22DRAFT_463973 [Trametopsis cervina]
MIPRCVRISAVLSFMMLTVIQSLEIRGEHEHAQELAISDTTSIRSFHEYEKLPFFGPPDPTRWPLHKTLFLGGLLFPPLWIVGAILPVRDAYDNWAELFRMRCQAAAMIIVIIGVAILILETAFRDS